MHLLHSDEQKGVETGLTRLEECFAFHGLPNYLFLWGFKFGLILYRKVPMIQSSRMNKD